MKDVADELLALSIVTPHPAPAAQWVRAANTADTGEGKVEKSQRHFVMKSVIEDAVLIHGQVEAGGWRAEARRHPQELQKGRNQLKLKILAGKTDHRLCDVIKQHLQENKMKGLLRGSACLL